MKKFLPVMIGLLCLPAVAEVAPVDYWAEESAAESPYQDEYEEGEEAASSASPAVILSKPAAQAKAAAAKPAVSARTQQKSAQRAVASRSATRAVSAAPGAASVRSSGASRAVSSRSAASSIRSFGSLKSGKTVSPRQSAGSGAANAARAGLTQANTITQPLYNPTDARVGVRGTAIGSVSGARVSSISMGGTPQVTAEDIGATMEEVSQLSDFCKAQYYSCMDNFCNTLDENQGRCSCSGNITNYKKTEDALKQATEELQDVAMKIQYLGLTKDEITSLFTQTEAEAAMSSTQDTTQLKNDLDKIKKLVVDVKSGTSSGFGSEFGLDFGNLDLTLDTGFDLSSLFGTGGSSVSNQRGAELYKTASSRCKASVLNTCKNQGVDTALLTNGYDLEIDRQCIAYERALDDSNSAMKRTVRNATAVLQKARLVVAQARNSYDMRGCVSALDACMQSEFVCGDDYSLCLDPTGKYIVNGEIVASSTSSKISEGLDRAWGCNEGGGYASSNPPCGNSGAWWDLGGLSSWIDDKLGKQKTGGKIDTSNMVGFLEMKIGRNETGKNTGMCMDVLNKCQDYTYTGSGTNKKYALANTVVKEYLMQALTAIKARQDTLVADYAGSCKADIQSCLITNGAIIGDSSGLSVGYVSPAMFNACKTLAETCAGSSGDATAVDLVFEIACSTADLDGTYCKPNGKGCRNSINSAISKVWEFPRPTSDNANAKKSCYCPYEVTTAEPTWWTTWSGATKTCSCPSGSSWNWESSKCTCDKANETFAGNACGCKTTGYGTRNGECQLCGDIGVGYVVSNGNCVCGTASGNYATYGIEGGVCMVCTINGSRSGGTGGDYICPTT